MTLMQHLSSTPVNRTRLYRPSPSYPPATTSLNCSYRILSQSLLVLLHNNPVILPVSAEQSRFYLCLILTLHLDITPRSLDWSYQIWSSLFITLLFHTTRVISRSYHPPFSTFHLHTTSVSLDWSYHIWSSLFFTLHLHTAPSESRFIVPDLITDLFPLSTYTLFHWVSAGRTKLITSCCHTRPLFGRFSEAGLHEWMPFVIFRTKSREKS